MINYQDNMKGCRLDKRRLLENKGMLKALSDLQANLAFSQCKMKTALDLVGKRCAQGWPRKLSDGEMEDFAVTVARRIRVQCRCLSQAGRKKPEWLDSFWLEELKEEKKTEGHDERPQAGATLNM